MSTSVENAQFLNELNMRVIRNKESNKPLREGITDEEYERFLEILRPARAGASVKAPSKARKTVQAVSDEELDSLFDDL